MKNKTKTPEKKVWVEVEVNKYTDGITVFRGQISEKDLEAWSCGEFTECALKLEKTYWFLEDTICMLGQGEDTARQYTGETYLRADTIMLMFVLKEDSLPNQNKSNLDNIFPFPGRTKQ